MARVTVEDCVDKVPNRFDLVLLSAHRAREISGGSELTIDRDRDKNPVKTIAARRAGVTQLLFPDENRKDYEELDESITEGAAGNRGPFSFCGISVGTLREAA